MKIILFLVLLAAASTTATIVVSEGRCPYFNAQETLKFERYLGVWYEYMRFPAIFESGLECTSAVYNANSDGSIDIVNEGYLRADIFGRNFILDRSVAEGNAVVPDERRPAELSVSFPPMDSNGRVNYNVLFTDYDTYAVVYSCQELWTVNIQNAWILTRERGVRPESLNVVLSRLISDGIDVGNFITVNQDECPPVTLTKS